MLSKNPFWLVLGGVFCFLDFAWLRDHGLSHPDAVIWVQWLSWVYLAIIARGLGAQQARGLFLGSIEDWKSSIDVRGWSWKIYTHSVAAFLAGVATVSTDYFWSLPVVTLFAFAYHWFGKPLGPGLRQCDLMEKGNELPKNSTPQRNEKKLTFTDTSLFIFGALLSIALVAVSIANGHVAINSTMSFLFIASQAYIILALPHAALSPRGAVMDSGHRDDMSLVHAIALQVSILFSICLAIVRPCLSALNVYAFVIPAFGATQMLCFFSLVLQDCAVPASTFQTIAIGILQATIRNESMVSSEIAIIGIIAVSQTVATIPSHAKGSAWLILLALLPASAIIRPHLPISAPEITALDLKEHPIEILFAQAKTNAERLEARQSKSIPAAVQEYRRRYKRDPPPHFDKWFELAQDADMVLVDEFDTVMQTIEPFWGEDPRILRARVRSAIESTASAPPGHNLIEFKIVDRRITWGLGSRYTGEIETWLGRRELAILPDLTFALNGLDEPRVVVRHDILDRAMQEKFPATQPHRGLNGKPHTRLPDKDSTVSFLDIGAQDNWQATTLSCDDYDAAVETSSLTAPMNLGFVQNFTAAFDVCSHPSFRRMHGVFLSPASMRLTHSLVPIFSQGKPSSFNDVIYPSAHYGLEMNAPPSPFTAIDVEWDRKQSQAYWAGSSTGGISTSETWQNMQRQRFVLRTSKEYLEKNEVALLHEDISGQWIPYRSTVRSKHAIYTLLNGTRFNSTDALFLTELFNVSMSRVIQCDMAACESQFEAFHLDPQIDLPGPNVFNQFKYVLDLDGNGYSGRYYRLLKSSSAVLKQTILSEWHDDWLVPWIHFIPVSLEAGEIYEMMRFLITDERGDKIGRAIGEEGRKWAKRVLRKRDLELVMVRILMEYGRVMNDDRDNMAYSP